MVLLMILNVKSFNRLNRFHFQANWRNVFISGTSNIKIFVLDEADEMLSRGFKDQIHDVFRTLGTEVQVSSIVQ